MISAWPMVTLGNVCELRYGKSLPKQNRSGAGFGVFGSNGQVGLHSNALTRGPTIVVGRKGSYGEVAFSADPCWPIDTAYFVDGESTDADLRWLYYRMKALPLTTLNRAAAVPGLNRVDAYAQTLLLPPIEEQRRIAAVLDAADALRAKRREALARLDTLTQAIFIDMFGTPEANVHGFPVLELGELVEVKGGKRLPKGAEYSQQPSGLPYIRVTDFRGGVIETDDLRFLTQEVQQRIRRYTVAAGDVVISIAGSIGQIASVPKRLDGANLTENAAKLVRRDPASLTTEYLASFLRSGFAQRQIAAKTGQVTIGKLALFRIASLKALLPPAELQLRYEAALLSVRRSTQSLEQSRNETERLFASLQQRAFRGEL